MYQQLSNSFVAWQLYKTSRVLIIIFMTVWCLHALALHITNIFPYLYCGLLWFVHCCLLSPLSPIVANLYMEHFEKIVLESNPLQPKLWLRYVNDTFVIKFWPHGQSTLRPLLEHLNSMHTSIQFWRLWQQIAFLICLWNVLITNFPPQFTLTLHSAHMRP